VLVLLCRRNLWPTCQSHTSTTFHYFSSVPRAWSTGLVEARNQNLSPSSSSLPAPEGPKRSPPPLRPMQTPATTCGAHAAAAFAPFPSHAAPPGSFVKPCPGSCRRAPRLRLVAPTASTVDSPGSSSDFVKRIERAWLISQVPPESLTTRCSVAFIHSIGPACDVPSCPSFRNTPH
jgi:hypothetical protein